MDNWTTKLVLRVKEPKKSAVTTSLTDNVATKQSVIDLQNKLAALVPALNKGVAESEALGVRIDLILTSKGPKQGKLIGSLIYESTTKEMAAALNAALTGAGIVLK